MWRNASGGSPGTGLIPVGVQAAVAIETREVNVPPCFASCRRTQSSFAESMLTVPGIATPQVLRP
jgi:hypothetical protein